MKFRPHRTLFVYGIAGLIVFFCGMIFFAWVTFLPGGKAGIVFIVGCIWALIMIFRHGELFFAKIHITKQGIISKCILKKPSLLLWEDVKDCGIINATTSPVDKIYCIYFSSEKLTVSQKLGKVTNSKDKNEVMSKLVKIPLCIDAINEIERYAPERILDLLKNDSVYPYTEIVAEFREQAEKRKNKKNK